MSKTEAWGGTLRVTHTGTSLFWMSPDNQIIRSLLYVCSRVQTNKNMFLTSGLHRLKRFLNQTTLVLFTKSNPPVYREWIKEKWLRHWQMPQCARVHTCLMCPYTWWPSTSAPASCWHICLSFHHLYVM